MSEKEIWKVYNGFNGRYVVSNRGRVFTKLSNRLISLFKDKDGYQCVCLCKKGKQKTVKVHRMVAETFIVNNNHKYEVNHKNGIKTDNRVENLEWVSKSQNVKHAYDTGLIKPRPRGEKAITSKLKEHQVIEILKRKEKVKDMAKKYSVGKTTIYRILRGEAWKHIKR